MDHFFFLHGFETRKPQSPFIANAQTNIFFEISHFVFQVSHTGLEQHKGE